MVRTLRSNGVGSGAVTETPKVANGTDTPKETMKSLRTPQEKSKPNKTLNESAEDAKSTKSDNNGKTDTPVKSFAFLLQQGIISNDAEKVFSAIKASAKDRPSSFQTATDLDVSKVIPLLQLINRVFREGQKKRVTSVYLRDLKYWIDFLEVTLQAHATFLSTVTNLNEQIGGLIEYVEARTSNLEKLMKLDGKITFFCEQIQRRLNPVKYVEQAPQVLFEDDLSDSDIDPTKEHSAEIHADSDEEADWFGDDDKGLENLMDEEEDED
ncbi:unnamed protein product [Bursaphelenchus okinawaensis]|uniref:Small-subunit processome Utp12 domain-containing protein n=1 Tax=Bursaphelenchus okinawaensis TaxID=465554 RepID=A0A811LFG3_9BILA|nr:unnamed protein product [Bursaphelenchus okinawaensis]CAG9121457.1 unnamed protein product [Bursaphelenchus okinawaensis]